LKPSIHALAAWIVAFLLAGAATSTSAQMRPMPALGMSLRYQTLHIRGQNHPPGVAVEVTRSWTVTDQHSEWNLNGSVMRDQYA
jgi:hypothetical protein